MDLTTHLPEGTPPCPDGRPQRLCELLGFRPKSVDLLQLRVVLRDSDGGVCHATVEEHSDRVCVRAVACLEVDEETGWPIRPCGREMDCPIRVWLHAPLGARIVIDLDTGQELPYFIPHRHLDEPSFYVPRPPGDLWPPPVPPNPPDPRGPQS